ncbi:MAG TPA: type I-E CRISPR-associated protein Cas7/Cse4/CasC [Sedimenticola thiotaurini]|uniref:Type I-E CRISPR-associated protein Cas7/Cse4/CasC n=1 Tax=Sedimenticola thiotaurini TaxID=1543721 RepID=A0A831W9V1_9GAMM|nr:type I-E CRISPR-associated protein Cas7/Cse4/CasC [Sedimenticola thiotaurini]
MFLQIHSLTSYHASLLNRDDAGLAKRIPFGGAERLRVSSQCQKRHWRVWMMERARLPSGIRSRYFFSRELKSRLVENGMDDALVHGLLLELAKNLFTSKENKDVIDKETLQMKQPVLFGRPEADYFVGLVRQAATQGDEDAAKKWLAEQIKAARKNFKAMLRQAGIDSPAAGFEGALFGRFVTSDLLARVDAPVHVAHAFTTHALDTEVDFFTVVDDLAGDDETGAAHANDTELGAGIFYGYVAVDVPLLVSNLTGCDRKEWREQATGDARELLDQLIHAIATVTPGAKLGATAPYARAEHLVLEVGDGQPRSLANAYLQPVRFERDTHPMAQSVTAMAGHLDALTGMYGDDVRRREIAGLHPWPRQDETPRPLDEAIAAVLDELFGGA